GQIGDPDPKDEPMSDQTDDPGPARPQEPPWEPAQPPPWEVVVEASAELGERPVWDPSMSCLTWVDINAGRLHRYTPGGGNDVVIEPSADGQPIPIGAAAHRGSGGYVLAAADGFRLAGPDGSNEAGPWRPPDMPDHVRFNDGVCDPAGRFWAGTVAHDVRPGGGGLYRLDPGGAITTVLEGGTEWHGLGWGPHGATLSFIASRAPP